MHGTSQYICTRNGTASQAVARPFFQLKCSTFGAICVCLVCVLVPRLNYNSDVHSRGNTNACTPHFSMARIYLEFSL